LNRLGDLLWLFARGEERQRGIPGQSDQASK